MKPSGWLAARVAVFLGDPFAEDVNRHGFRYRLNARTGALFLNEAELRWSRAVREIQGGPWFHTERFADTGSGAVAR